MDHLIKLAADIGAIAFIMLLIALIVLRFAGLPQSDRPWARFIRTAVRYLANEPVHKHS